MAKPPPHYPNTSLFPNGLPEHKAPDKPWRRTRRKASVDQVPIFAPKRASRIRRVLRWAFGLMISAGVIIQMLIGSISKDVLSDTAKTLFKSLTGIEEMLKDALRPKNKPTGSWRPTIEDTSAKQPK